MRKKIRKDRRKQLGILLQKERKCLRLDQEDVAQMLGVTQEQISKIESGTRRLDVMELMEYCEALHLTPTALAGKIETYFFSMGLLPRPVLKHLDESNVKEKVKVDVQWCDKNFKATISNKNLHAKVLLAKTFGELKKDISEILRLLVEDMKEDVNEVPQWLREGNYDLEYNFLDVQSLLKAYSPNVSLASISRASGINQSQLSQYANGVKIARPYQIKLIKDALHIIGEELMAMV